MPKIAIFSVANQKKRRVAHSRFSNLLHQRIGKDQDMKRILGEEHWQTFTKIALKQCKPWFMKAFIQGEVVCNGQIDGKRCEYQNEGSSGLPLHAIHCDHTTDLNNICSS